MKKLLVILFLVTLTFQSSLCLAENSRWELVWRGQNSSYYFDKETINYRYIKEIDQVCIDFWTKQTYTSEGELFVTNSNKQTGDPKAACYENLTYILNHNLYSKNHQFCFIGTYFYNSRGIIIDTFIPLKLTFNDIPPESPFEADYKMIMEYVKKNDQLLKSRM